MEVKHDVPTLNAVGTGTMVSDGLSMINAEFSASSFRVAPVVIGRNNFLGNGIAYPPGGRTGDNCLLGTKVMIPVSGPVRQGVGLLGSPCFEIPARSAATGSSTSSARPASSGGCCGPRTGTTRHDGPVPARALAVRHRVLLVAHAAVRDGSPLDAWPALRTVVATCCSPSSTSCWSSGRYRFRALRPQFCSIYDPLLLAARAVLEGPSIAYIPMFSGTPFKGVVWRLLGVRIGRRVFDDGCSIMERTLVSDRRRRHAQRGQHHPGPFPGGRRLQVRLHHHRRRMHRRQPAPSSITGSTMGDGAVLDADSFLMKGEHVPPGSWWSGNPATRARAARPAAAFSRQA